MKVLSVSVHPDDETLGCGATLLKHLATGDSIHWLLVTAAHETDYPADQIRQQVEQVKRVEQAYPFESLAWLKFAAARLETIPLKEIVHSMRRVLEHLRPQIVYCPNRSDVHSDHRISHQAIQGVLKSFYMRGLGVERVLACEVASETDAAAPLPEDAFLPNVYVDVSATIERKLEIMSLYKTELQSQPMPRSLSSVRAHARYRGASIGVDYAEAFMLIREIT